MPKITRSIDAPADATSIVKPGELIDIVEISPLTLQDRRIFNELIAHAWDTIGEPVTHSIAKKELRGSHNVNDRVGESVQRLMAAIVRVRVSRGEKPATLRVQLLGPTQEEHAADGMLHYRFSAEMRSIIRQSTVFARIQRDVMYHLSSKYALALYELVQRRGNLSFKHREEFTIAEFRSLLGVRKGELERFADLHRRAIKPAVDDINAVGEVSCFLEPMVEGRKVVRVRLSWARKNPDELREAWRELQRSKVGRRARSARTVQRMMQATDG